MGKVIVEIRNDWEGMFSCLTEDELNSIDIDRTLVEYESKLYAELKLEYRDIEFELYYGPYGGPSILIDCCDDFNEESEISETVSEIIGTVYERGDFWITK